MAVIPRHRHLGGYVGVGGHLGESRILSLKCSLHTDVFPNFGNKSVSDVQSLNTER